MNDIKDANVTEQKPFGLWMAIISFVIIFAGIGRMFSLVLHDPLLGYGNSYDMIRIQACHQIWPADTTIDITQGTPAAPLRWYRQYDSHLDVKCFPSSELMFTSAGINFAKTTHWFTDGKDISIMCVGFMRALILSFTVLFVAVVLYHHQATLAMFVNAVIFLVVLTDPGITLYLNTFYTEFSAVYFLYLLLASLSLFFFSNRKTCFYVLGIMALLGLGLSKPQHIPLTMLLGTYCSGYLLRQKMWWKALVTLLVSVLPLILYVSGTLAPRNEIMELANSINAWGALLESSAHPALTLTSLGLPEHCQALVGAYWQGQASLDHPPCDEIRAMNFLAKPYFVLIDPQAFTMLLNKAIPLLKDWTLMVYGNVEGEQFASVTKYQHHLWELFRIIPNTVFFALFLIPLLVWLFMLLLLLSGIGGMAEVCWLGLIVIAQWVTFLTALLGDGFYDLTKHSHLAVPMMVSFYLYLICKLVQVLGWFWDKRLDRSVT